MSRRLSVGPRGRGGQRCFGIGGWVRCGARQPVRTRQRDAVPVQRGRDDRGGRGIELRERHVAVAQRPLGLGLDVPALPGRPIRRDPVDHFAGDLLDPLPRHR